MCPNWPLILRQLLAETDCEIRDIARHCGVKKNTVEKWLYRVHRPNFECGWEILNAYVARVSKSIPQDVHVPRTRVIS